MKLTTIISLKSILHDIWFILKLNLLFLKRKLFLIAKILKFILGKYLSLKILFIIFLFVSGSIFLLQRRFNLSPSKCLKIKILKSILKICLDAYLFHHLALKHIT